MRRGSEAPRYGAVMLHRAGEGAALPFNLVSGARIGGVDSWTSQENACVGTKQNMHIGTVEAQLSEVYRKGADKERAAFSRLRVEQGAATPLSATPARRRRSGRPLLFYCMARATLTSARHLSAPNIGKVSDILRRPPTGNRFRYAEV